MTTPDQNAPGTVSNKPEVKVGDIIRSCVPKPDRAPHQAPYGHVVEEVHPDGTIRASRTVRHDDTFEWFEDIHGAGWRAIKLSSTATPDRNALISSDAWQGKIKQISRDLEHDRIEVEAGRMSVEAFDVKW